MLCAGLQLHRRLRQHSPATPGSLHPHISQSRQPSVPAGAPQPLLSLAAVIGRAGGGYAARGSTSASGSSAAYAAAVAAASAAGSLRLTDISPGVDVERHLWEWAGLYTLQPDGPGSALLHFSKPSAYTACSDALGGGVRGCFRVDRSYSAAGTGGSSSGAGTGGTALAAASTSRMTVLGRSKGAGRAASAAPRVPVLDPWDSDSDGATASQARQLRAGADGAQELAARRRDEGASAAALAEPSMWEALLGEEDD